MENCGGEFVRRIVVLSWFLDVQQIHAVVFYKITYLPQQKSYISEIRHNTRYITKGTESMSLLALLLLVTSYTKRRTSGVWPAIAERSDSGSRIFVE